MKFLIMLEPTPTGFSADSSDLDGCVAAGANRCETIELIRDTIEFHLEGLIAEGLSIPSPQSESIYVDVDS